MKMPARNARLFAAVIAQVTEDLELTSEEQDRCLAALVEWSDTLLPATGHNGLVEWVEAFIHNELDLTPIGG